MAFVAPFVYRRMSGMLKRLQGNPVSKHRTTLILLLFRSSFLETAKQKAVNSSRVQKQLVTPVYPSTLPFCPIISSSGQPAVNPTYWLPLSSLHSLIISKLNHHCRRRHCAAPCFIDYLLLSLSFLSNFLFSHLHWPLSATARRPSLPQGKTKFKLFIYVPFSFLYFLKEVLYLSNGVPSLISK